MDTEIFQDKINRKHEVQSSEMEDDLLMCIFTGMQTWWIQFHRESNIEQYISKDFDVRRAVK